MSFFVLEEEIHAMRGFSAIRQKLLIQEKQVWHVLVLLMFVLW